MTFLIRFLDHVSFRYGRWRNWWRVFWLKRRGAEVGRNVWIGRRVEFRLGRNASLRIGPNVVINDYAVLIVGPAGSLEIGASTYIGRYCEISSHAHSRIGRDCAVAAFCNIIDTDHVYLDPAAPVNAQGARLAQVCIEDEVWLGYRVTVLRGVRLGRHCVVGAGAVVTRDIPALAVAVGMPARVIKQLPSEGTGPGRRSDAACPAPRPDRPVQPASWETC